MITQKVCQYMIIIIIIMTHERGTRQNVAPTRGGSRSARSQSESVTAKEEGEWPRRAEGRRGGREKREVMRVLRVMRAPGSCRGNVRRTCVRVGTETAVKDMRGVPSPAERPDAKTWIENWRQNNGAAEVAVTEMAQPFQTTTEKKKKSLRIFFEAAGRKKDPAQKTKVSSSDDDRSPSTALITMNASTAVVAPEGVGDGAVTEPAGSAAAYMRSLPGIAAPLGFWDPLNLTDQCKTVSDVKFFREAELMHARTAMMAFVGVLFGEKLPALNNFFEKNVSGPAVTHWSQVDPAWLVALGLLVSTAEIIRADRGWVEPSMSRKP